MYQLHDTIFALSTPLGQAALSIIRVSGEQAITGIDSLFSRPLLKVEGNTTYYGYILSASEKQPIDEVVISVYRSPKSFTGEDMVEINCHGSLVVIKLLQEELGKLPSFRLAEPGEFSLRAFANKKMDLTKAESIADLIHAESEAAHKVAIHQIKDGFAKKLLDLRQELVDFAALLELELDFSEEDVEFAQRGKLRALCDHLLQEISRLIGSFKYGNAIKEGINTAIVGMPNAGKSTLLNALLNEERAIVSAIPGTTRDTIKERFVVKGVQFNLVDTAGIREETQDEIEVIGIQKAKDEIRKASMVLYCIDATCDIEQLEIEFKKGIEMNAEIFFTKLDELNEEKLSALKNKFQKSRWISAKKNNIQSLLDLFDAKAAELSEKTTAGLITNQRHLIALQKAESSLEQAIAGIDNQMYIEQIAADLKEALFHLGSLTGGSIEANEILGSVFSRFCIGK